MANQNKKNSRREESTTCNPNGNPGPVNKIRTVQAHRIINAKALRVLPLITGFTGELFEEGSSELFLHTEKVLFVDQNGRLRGVYNGSLSFEVEKLIVDIELLSM